MNSSICNDTPSPQPPTRQILKKKNTIPGHPSMSTPQLLFYCGSFLLRMRQSHYMLYQHNTTQHTTQHNMCDYKKKQAHRKFTSFLHNKFPSPNESVKKHPLGLTFIKSPKTSKEANQIKMIETPLIRK